MLDSISGDLLSFDLRKSKWVLYRNTGLHNH